MKIHFFGNLAGKKNNEGYGNTFIGTCSGINNTTGYDNLYIGNRAGYVNKTGSSNIFIGSRAGYRELGSSKLYIDNSATSDPLIYGDFQENKLKINGNLNVNGFLTHNAKDINADYVFDSEYKLESIEEHAKHMFSNGHLKAVPKAKKNNKGQDVVEYGSHIKGILEELEKAHIYIHKLNETIKNQQQVITKLSERIDDLKK